MTVLMSTYNRPERVCEAVASVVAQTYQNWCLWVLNDGGLGVETAVRQASAGDRRVHYFDRPHEGKAGQLNWACARLATPFVAYLDDDDAWFADHLAVLLAALEAEQGAQAAYSDVLEVRLDSEGHRRQEWVDSRACIKLRDLLTRNVLNHNALVHRAELLARTGPYDPRLTVLIDWDILRRMAWRTSFTHVGAVTVEHRVRLDSRSRVDSQHLTGQAFHKNAAYRRSYLRVFFKPPWSRG